MEKTPTPSIYSDLSEKLNRNPHTSVSFYTPHSTISELFRQEKLKDLQAINHKDSDVIMQEDIPVKNEEEDEEELYFTESSSSSIDTNNNRSSSNSNRNHNNNSRRNQAQEKLESKQRWIKVIQKLSKLTGMLSHSIYSLHTNLILINTP
jgi:hypothetical protein